MKSFTVENILTWGLTFDKEYGGYKLPVSFRDSPDVVKNIEKIANKHECEKVFYGDSKTLYFKLWGLSEKQSMYLLEKGRKNIDIGFEVLDPVESKNGKIYLRFNVVMLRENTKDVVAPSD